jgi:hypothetical protein
MLVTLTALAVAPAAANADDTGKATGGGKSPGGLAQAGGPIPFGFAFTAQDTLAPKGHFVFQRPEGSFEGTVTCYTQEGKEAAFSGPITEASGIFAGMVGETAYYGVQDNGQGARATGPDRIQVELGPQHAGNCPISPVYPYEVTSGNIKVHRS